MGKPLDRPMGRIGLAIAAIGIICGAVSSHAQVEQIIQVRIGLVEFRIPKDFVSNQITKLQSIQLEFSYPEIEAVGRLRFGDDITRWDDHRRSLINRGGQILDVKLEAIDDPEPLLRGQAEKERIVNSICLGFAGGKIDSYPEFDVDFFKCLRGNETLTHRGHHRPTGLLFSLDLPTSTWRLVRLSLEERVRTTVAVPNESLKNWKAIIARAHATIDSWKK